MLILRELKRAGFYSGIEHAQVFTAADLEKHLKGFAWDVILSDFNMPGFDALAALSLKKQFAPDTPFLVISGAVGEETAVELMKAGAEDFITKSNMGRLVPAIERSIKDAAVRRREEIAHLAAEKAVRMREDMLAIVSHDVRNPLSAIKLGLKLIEKTLLTPVTNERDTALSNQVARLQRSADRMNSLINDILDHINAILSEVAEIFVPLAASKSLQLHICYLPNDPLADFDRERIFQVFSNFLGNAIKFTPSGGDITIEANEQLKDYVFDVKDSGCGMPEEHLPHVFDRYWQAQNTARQGTGLGLSIAHGIVLAHGGKVWVNSKVGEGTVFSFNIPKLLP